MKTKFKVLGILVLLLVPFAAANAGPFTLDGVKKASGVWLNHGGNGIDLIGSVAGWNNDSYVEGVQLANNSKKSASLNVAYSGENDVKYAIFKNGALKRWGAVVFDGTTYDVLKYKRKAFNASEWQFSSLIVVKDPEGSPAPSNQPSEGGSVQKPGDEQPAGPYGETNGGTNGGGESAGSPNGGGPAPVPEPATMLLLGSGLIGLAGAARKKFKK